MSLITIKVFDNPIEANILKARLEMEGVDVFLFDEHTVGLNPLYNITVGGIKMKINQDDFLIAQKILEQIDETPLTNDQDEVVKCPRCGSTNFYEHFKSMKSKTGIAAAVLSFFTGTYPLYYDNVFRCKDCEKEWKNEME